MRLQENGVSFSDYLKAIEIDSTNNSSLDNLGYSYLATGDSVSALENFNKCIKQKPDNIDAILGVALVYYYKNDMENAKKYINRAKGLNAILKQGVEGFESFKKEGWFYSEKDDASLKKMFEEFK
jgi:tetratricopeptide (TPR) repeat protein